MPKFAVFFSDGAGFGIEMVQALDVPHAEDITRAQHPAGRLSAVPAELHDGQEHQKFPRTRIKCSPGELLARKGASVGARKVY